MGKGSRARARTGTDTSPVVPKGDAEGATTATTASSAAEAAPSAPVDSNMDGLVDMRQPLVWQVLTLASLPVAEGGMSREAYVEWVHRPYYYKTDPKHMHFFHTPILERFSKTVWYAVPLIWIPVIALTTWYFGSEFTAPTVASTFVLGVFYWTFLEYMLHRFLFHMDHWIPDTPLGICFHFMLHGCHHKVPNDRYRLVFPPPALVPIAAVVGPLSRLLLLPFIPNFNMFMVFFAGAVFGYVIYDMTHYMTHHGNLNPKSVLGRIRRYHLRHHYNDQYDVGFGITSAFWDHVFGTVLDVNRTPTRS